MRFCRSHHYTAATAHAAHSRRAQPREPGTPPGGRDAGKTGARDRALDAVDSGAARQDTAKASAKVARSHPHTAAPLDALVDVHDPGETGAPGSRGAARRRHDRRRSVLAAGTAVLGTPLTCTIWARLARPARPQQRGHPADVADTRCTLGRGRPGRGAAATLPPTSHALDAYVRTLDVLVDVRIADEIAARGRAFGARVRAQHGRTPPLPLTWRALDARGRARHALEVCDAGGSGVTRLGRGGAPSR